MAHPGSQSAGFHEELATLPFGGAGDHNEGAWLEGGAMKSGDGRYGGLAPLAGAIQDATFRGTLEDFGL